MHEKVYAPFLDRLKAAVESLKVGVDTDFSVDMGAMTTDRPMSLVRAHIEDALARGARVAACSPTPLGGEGRFLSATVLVDVDHGMRVMREETFGPVLAVMKVRDMNEAVRLANDSIHGLTGSVWSGNPQRAEAIGRRIQAGVITINDHLVSHGMPETPWGGFKVSGIGRTHGELGFQEMTQPQVIVHDWLGSARRNLWWPPYNRLLYDGLKGALQFCYASSPFRRAAGLIPLLKVLPRLFR